MGERAGGSAPWSEVKRIFQEVVDLPLEERTSHLEGLCARGSRVRAEVDALLDHHDQAGGFLEDTVRELAANLVAESDDDAPQTVGPYRVVREIGRGGMGRVYLGERADDQFEQRVAIKVIKRGMDTDEIHRRFLAERQILARLRHPNIGRLLDGGVTQDGRPYFVMEHIEGQTLLEHVRRQALDLRARLALFRQVCEAVHVAHQNLVLHRDLKPSNILVELDGTPKLLDFGVAKVLESDDDRETPATAVGPRYLTLAYASPEQVRGLSLTTGADVYGLGVLLYELLTGGRPHETRGLSAGEAELAICTEPPVPPSQVVQEAGLDRKRLAGDLDAITLKALRKDPAERYESVERLAEDVGRYLEGLPVQARAGARLYALRRFVGRHRWGVAAAAVILIAISAAAGVFAAQSVRIARESEKTLRVSALLVDLLSGSDPAESLGDTLTARALLDRSTDRINAELNEQPEIRATLLQVVGELYHSLGLFNEARVPLEQALEVREAILSPGHPDIASSMNALGVVLDASGDFEGAQPLFEGALRIRRVAFRTPSAETAESLNSLGQLLLYARQDFDAAEPLLVEALDMRRQVFEPPHRDVAETVHNLALLHQLRGDYAGAAPLYEESLEMRRELYGSRHPALVSTINNLGLLSHQTGDYARAEALYRESLALRRELLGAEHPSVAIAYVNLGYLLTERGDLAGAEEQLRTGLRLCASGFGTEHPRWASAASNLADLLRIRGRIAEAEDLYRRSLSVRRRALGERHPHVAYSLNGLAEIDRARGDLTTADSLHRAALRLRTEVLGPDHLDVAQSWLGLGRIAGQLDNDAGAVEAFRSALAIREKGLGPSHPLVAEVEAALGSALARAGALEEGERSLRDALEIRRASFGPDHWRTAEAEADLALVMMSRGRADEVAALVDHAIPVLEATFGGEDVRVRQVRSLLGPMD